MAGPSIKGTRAFSEDVGSNGGNKSIRQSPFASKDTATGYKPGADKTVIGKFEVDKSGGSSAPSVPTAKGAK